MYCDKRETVRDVSQPASGSSAPPLPEIPPLIVEAQQAFLRDLAQLLQDRSGQWVAYHGGRQVGFAPTKTQLYRECLRQGIDEEEFIVQCIEPDAGTLTLGPLAVE